ncbi:hypothetical protein HXX76_003845 [Chlamydomonas incerta]|uniref:Uncharacterized protein n=1 Tax=Chlamydomonas incerta TaxID=51695 RepID=A0A835T8R1_CHLIN|nr:hypothetical protein HXX76_003845 [Chlamydomonas incerta]|eukprot:KAG2440992.1 hypothetical protein HXX76_003845 [Chlamydomonas incerta]
MLLRRMPVRQICSGASKDEGLDDEAGNTALHFSVSINHHRGIRKLMRYGTPPSLANAAGKTPLHLALEGGRLKAGRILLEKAAAAVTPPGKRLPPSPINIPDRNGVTPLMAVVASGRLKFTREVIAVCKELNIDINFDQKDLEGNSLLSYAAKWGWFDELGVWLDKVVRPPKILNLQNKQGETVLGHVLHFNASAGDGGVLLPRARALALADKLLALGALAKVPAFQERVPPINLAAAVDDPDIYNLLLAKGAVAGKAKDALGRTPLHYAAAKGAARVGADLLEKGLKAYALDSQGNTPLHLAAMRGQEKMVNLLLEKADDKTKALLTPNRSGLSAYHLALKAGPDDAAQSNSLALIEVLADKFTAPVVGRKKAVVDTPLLLAISGHQDQVVKKLLELGVSPNEGNVRGELPLARVLSAATAITYDNDSSVFDQLIAAGADMDSAGETSHPLLAICKNNLSTFAEKAVGVLSGRCGALDWAKRDDKGYTPLALAAYWDNAWLVRHLIDAVGVNPNAPEQRSMSTEPEVVGTTGSLCCTKPITVAGTIEGQTPLMCAAKGASVAAVQLLLNRGADVNAVDGQGRTPLQHAMALDKPASLQVAAALLQMGARPERGLQLADGWKECRDLLDETWPHRAVRYGCHEFLELWACCGGALELTATTADDADDMPGAELAAEEKGDFLDVVPRRTAAVVDEEDEELVDDYNGEDSEVPDPNDQEDDKRAPEGGAGQTGEGTIPAGGPVAESTEQRRRSGDVSSDDDCGPDEDEERELAELIAAGELESHYDGPTPRMLLRWRRRGAQWWDEFWVDGNALPDMQLEADPHWEDKYNACEEGDDWIDEEDVEDEIWESIRVEQRRAAVQVRMAAAAAGGASPGGGAAGGSATTTGSPASASASPSLIERMSAGLAHKLFKRRLPNAVVPPATSADEGSSFASGSPSKWLRRHSNTSKDTAAAVVGSPPAADKALRKAAGPIAEGNEGANTHDGDGEDEDEQEPLLGRTASRAKSSATRVQSRAQSMAVSVVHSTTKAVRNMGGKLTSGTAGEKLYANEPYFQPQSRYQGLPRYMMVDTQPADEAAVYGRHLAEFDARVRGYTVKGDKPLQGADLRARNITWYLKSMSPTEYPLKVGKWKSFLRLTKKAVEAAHQRRPCKPGQKPKPRKKTAWFGLPDLPSRPELARTSPLLYAVRLGRAKCVEVLLRYSAALVNMPDAHGVTPIGYAMFMLAKERHNKSLQQVVDMLLAAQPLVDAASIWHLQLLPQMEKDVAAMQAAVAAKDAAKEKVTRRERKELAAQQAALEFLRAEYSPRLVPTVMEPLVLAALMGDIGRMTVMVRRCGGDLNNSWVWLPDIPTYFQGQWEKQLGRCQSRVPPLHVVICSKKYDLVRNVLDLGADPNLCGGEFTGNHAEDLKKKVSIYGDKVREVNMLKANGANANPYAKLWADASAGLMMMLLGAKRFISSIEIPGLSRPHPWLSPLHLSCRFGLAEITFLLVTRGAAVNGGSVSIFAPKTPLEEALSYARANAQAYGTTSERFNYYHILERTCLETTPTNEITIDEAIQSQRQERRELEAQVKAKAQALADKSPVDEKGKHEKKPEDFLRKANIIIDVGASLARYNPESLLNIPLPGMNAAAAAGKGLKMLRDMASMMDPIKGSIKAVALAAKVIIKILLAMMKRPIAHYDPALYCAHVMLYHRSPINLGEKQTGILMRDILDNGNGIQGANKALSYYQWLGLTTEQVNDEVWVETVISKVSVLKANVKYGFMSLDLTPLYQDYERIKKKFMSAVQSAVLSTGTASVMPQYYQYLVTRGLEGSTGAAASAAAQPPVPQDSKPAGSKSMRQQREEQEQARAKALLMRRSASVSQAQVAAKLQAQVAAKLQEWIKTYVDTQEAKYLAAPNASKIVWVKPPSEDTPETAGKPKPASLRDTLALELLPQWLQNAPEPGAEAQAVAEAREAGGTAGAAAPLVIDTSTLKVPTTEQEVTNFLIRRFLAYDPESSQPVVFKAPPSGPDVWDQMLTGTGPNYEDVDKIDFTMPDVDKAEIEAMRPTILDVTDADVCSAIVRAYNATLTRDAEAASAALQAQSRARAEAAMNRVKERLAATSAKRAEVMRQTATELQQPRGFDEEPVFVAAMENPMWEAAVNKLGGTPAAQHIMARLRAAQASGDIPSIPDPLQFAKGLGASAMDQGKAALFAKMESQLGQPFSAAFRQELGKGVPGLGPTSAGAQERGGSEEDPTMAAVDEIVDRVQGLAAAGDRLADAETYLRLAEDALGPSGRELLEMMQAWLQGQQGAPIDDMKEFAQELAQKGIHEAPDAVLLWMEHKTGVPLPDAVRNEMKSRVETFTDRIKEKYEEGGLSAAVGACTAIAGGCAVAIHTGAGEWVEAQMEQGMVAVQGVVDAAQEVLDGNLESLDDLAAGLLLQLPAVKKLREATAPITDALKETVGLLNSLGDAAKVLQGQVAAVTNDACSDLESLGTKLDTVREQVAKLLKDELAEAVDQFMAGLELMLEVDVQALVEALDDVREVLLMIIEFIGLDEFV